MMFSNNRYLIRKWQRWLRAIYRDLVALAAFRTVFWEVQEIVRSNPNVNVGSTFHDLIAVGYATYAAIAVRKQADFDKRSISLVLLLKDIVSNYRTLNRPRMIALYRRSNLSPAIANRHMDNSGRMAANYVDRRRVRQDLATLQNTCNKIKRHVNKRVAHSDRRPPRSIPTYADLNRAIDLLEATFKRYNFLIEGTALLRLTPTWQYDWKSVLRVPWIPSEVNRSN